MKIHAVRLDGPVYSLTLSVYGVERVDMHMTIRVLSM